MDALIDGCVRLMVAKKNLDEKESKKQLAALLLYWRRRICIALHNAVAYQLESRHMHLISLGRNGADQDEGQDSAVVMGNR